MILSRIFVDSKTRHCVCFDTVSVCTRETTCEPCGKRQLSQSVAERRHGACTAVEYSALPWLAPIHLSAPAISSQFVIPLTSIITKHSSFYLQVMEKMKKKMNKSTTYISDGTTRALRQEFRDEEVELWKSHRHTHERATLLISVESVGAWVTLGTYLRRGSTPAIHLAPLSWSLTRIRSLDSGRRVD